jgi:hypothetical protein
MFGEPKHKRYNSLMQLPKGGNYLDVNPPRHRRVLNLRPHKHSGRRLEHAHTSYAALTFVTMLAGVVLMMFSSASLANHTPSTGPQSGSIGLGGTVPGAPPATGAFIEHPTNGQVFTNIPILVDGTCTPQTFIQVFRNDVFSGSTICSDAGRFSLDIDLFDGSNRIIAKTFDAADQAGPDSNVVTVTYNPVRGQTGINVPILDPLRLSTDDGFESTFPNKEVVWTFSISGGKAPYAISIDWGDGDSSLVSQSAAGSFKAVHTYTSAGNFSVILKATDSASQTAYLQVLTIVNGEPVAGSGAKTSQTDNARRLFDTGILGFLWPLYLLVILMITSFWLGERWRQRQLAKKGLLLGNQF